MFHFDTLHRRVWTFHGQHWTHVGQAAQYVLESFLVHHNSYLFSGRWIISRSAEVLAFDFRDFVTCLLRTDSSYNILYLCEVSPVHLFYLQAVLLFTLIDFKRTSYGTYVFPVGYELLGWCMTIVEILCIPGVALYRLFTIRTDLPFMAVSENGIRTYITLTYCIPRSLINLSLTCYYMTVLPPDNSFPYSTKVLKYVINTSVAYNYRGSDICAVQQPNGVRLRKSKEVIRKPWYHSKIWMIKRSSQQHCVFWHTSNTIALTKMYISVHGVFTLHTAWSVLVPWYCMMIYNNNALFTYATLRKTNIVFVDLESVLKISTVL